MCVPAQTAQTMIHESDMLNVKAVKVVHSFTSPSGTLGLLFIADFLVKRVLSSQEINNATIMLT